MADGSRHSLSMVAETSYGVTPVTPVFQKIRHTGTTLGLTKEAMQSEELRVDRQIVDFRHGAFQTGGDINFELSYGSFDPILEAVLCGTWTGDVLTAGIERRSFTVERQFSDLLAAQKPYHRFTGVEFNKLSLSISANAMITGSVSVLGRGFSTDTVSIVDATYDAASTTTTLDSFTGELRESGALIAVITEITLDVDNGLETRFVVGSKETIRPSIKRSNVSGSITAYFEDSTLLDKFVNENESSIQFSLPDAAGNQLIFTLPRVKYNGGQPNVEGEGSVMLSLPFQALFDQTAETNISIERVPA